MSNTAYYAVRVSIIEQGANDEPREVYTYVVSVEAPGPDEARLTARAGVWLDFGAAKRLPKAGRA